ncbi:MAG: hypothetical protein WBD91_10270, partial [Acidobacteriaceae bacterium]
MSAIDRLAFFLDVKQFYLHTFQNSPGVGDRCWFCTGQPYRLVFPPQTLQAPCTSNKFEANLLVVFSIWSPRALVVVFIAESFASNLEVGDEKANLHGLI